MISTRKLILISILFISCIGCDQTTKEIARVSLQTTFSYSFLNGFVRLQYAENPGGMMSLGAGLHPEVRFWFLTVFVGVMLTSILLYTLLSRKLSRLQIASLTLIVAGGFSNLLDRLFNDGHVIDFLNIGIGNLRTAIFNLADVIILFGTLLLLLSTSRIPRDNSSAPPPVPEE
jgi:signal peptidase II